MNGESLRDIALELLEMVELLGEESIHERSGKVSEDMRKLKEDMAEYRRRIDSAK